MPISVEVISPERTFEVVNGVVPFAVDAFEGVGAGQVWGGFESGGGLSLGLALQHQAKSLWCSSL